VPLPLIPIILVILVLGGVVAALTFWNAITEFMLATLLPWFDANLPWLASLVREVFCQIDRVTVPLIQLIRKKWQQLKDWVLSHLVEVERTTQGKWVHRVVSYFRRRLESGQPQVVKVVTEETIDDLNQLPPEVRAQLIRDGAARVDLRPKVDEVLARLELEAVA
jgi:hypothetical protein